MDIGHSSNKEIGWLLTKQKLDICFCNPSQWNTLILMQTFTTFCIALFFTSKRKRRKCIFGRASIGFGRILQQRPNKSLPYKYPHTLMNALCYHPKKSDIRNFSSCEKIFFLRFCAIHIRKFERLTITSYLFSYNTFENTSEYKNQK